MEEDRGTERRRVYFFNPSTRDDYLQQLQQNSPRFKADTGYDLNFEKDAERGLVIKVQDKEAMVAQFYVRFLPWGRSLKVRVSKRNCSKETLENLLSKIAPIGHKVTEGEEIVDI